LKLLAPVSPFITEKIWQNLKQKNFVKEQSIHLCSWPEADKEKIDKKLEEDFGIVAKIIEAGMFERDNAKIGLKWPLALAEIDADADSKKIEKYESIIMNQLNVKKIKINKIKDLKEFKIKFDTKMTFELEAEGYSREFARKVQAERKNKGLKKGDLISLKVFCDANLAKMLKGNINFSTERTNSRKIDFTDEKSMKNKINFMIKEKKLSIELE